MRVTSVVNQEQIETVFSKPDLAVHAYNPTHTSEAKAGGMGVQGHPELHISSLGTTLATQNHPLNKTKRGQKGFYKIFF